MERSEWHCLGTKEGLSNSREELAGGRPAIPRQRWEAGGRGNGQMWPQRWHPYQTANRLPISNQRLLEILDGWHPLGESQLETSSLEQTQGAGTSLRGNWGWDRWGHKVHRTWGECARQAPGCLSCLGQEGTKRRPNRVCTFVEYLKTGTAHNSGPAPFRAAWSLSSVDGENAHARREWGQTEWGQPSVAGTPWVLPTRASDICLQCPSLPAAWLNKRT